MKWVRQRCQAAPGSVAAIASTRPGCASELTELDAGEAAGDEAAQEGEPGGAVLGGDDVEAERLAEALRLTPTACTTQTLTVRPPSRHLTTSASEHQVRVRGAVERAGAEVLDDPSSDFASRETWLFDIRSTPSCCTSFSTRRVETPAR